MAVVDFDIKFYGSASMPDSDSDTNIGGAISTVRKPLFTTLGSNDTVQYVSSDAGDVAETITVSYLDADNQLLTEAKVLTGLTPVAGAATMKTILKAVKSAVTLGDVAVEKATASRSNTATAGAADSITLDAGASAVDNFYRGMIHRLTGGTGSGQIRDSISYTGSSKVAKVSRVWGVNPAGDSVFRISTGFMFDQLPIEITEVRRVFYNALANLAGGATKTYYEKIFIKNTHATDSITSAQLALTTDVQGVITFGLEATLDGTGTNGGGNNRLVAPAGITFDATTKNIANSGIFTAGTAQGIWLKLTLPGGKNPADYAAEFTLQGVV